MTRIHGIAALSGRTYESVRHALELFVDAGCPREDRDHTGRKAFAYVYNDEHKETVSLFPPLPDRFAGKTRAEVRAMYDSGVRQWSYVEFWTAWLSGQ